MHTYIYIYTAPVWHCNSIVSYTIGFDLCTFIIKELRVAHLKCKELESQCRDEENSRTEFRDIKQVILKLYQRISSSSNTALEMLFIRW